MQLQLHLILLLIIKIINLYPFNKSIINYASVVHRRVGLQPDSQRMRLQTKHLSLQPAVIGRHAILIPFVCIFKQEIQ